MNIPWFNSPNVKNLLFDLGGVIVDLAPQKTKIAFKQMGMKLEIADSWEIFKGPLYLDYEIGQISDEQFRTRVEPFFSSEVSAQQFDEAWNAMLLNIPQHRVKGLQNLNKSYRCFVLSNSNAIHQKHFGLRFQEQYGFSLESLFEKVFYSHIEKIRKPSPEAFLNILKKTGISPSQTLFLDDALVNLETAQTLGFETFHVQTDLFEIFKAQPLKS